jgi:hypothetical protein
MNEPKMEKDESGWITLPNGVHVPVADDESKKDAVDEFVKTNELHKQTKTADRFEHPIHIYAKNKEKGKGLSLTTTKKDEGETKDAVPMRANPNPQDTRQSYFIPKSKEVMLKDLSEVLKKWKLNKFDDKDMKPYRDEPFNK